MHLLLHAVMWLTLDCEDQIYQDQMCQDYQRTPAIDQIHRLLPVITQI